MAGQTPSNADVEALSKTLADTGSEITIAQIRSLVQCFAVKTYRSPSPPPVEEHHHHRRDSSPSPSPEPEDEGPVGPPPPPPSVLHTLSKPEFVESVSAVLHNIDRAEIELWFQRIDADDQKCVSWSDFSTFLLSRAQYQHQTDTRSTEFVPGCIPQFPPPQMDCHSEAITVIRQHPKSSRIFTGAADGTVRAWSYDDMTHQRFVLNTENWVTDMCFIRNDTRLLVASVDRTVTVLDARSCDVVRTYEGRDLLGGKGITFANKTTEVVERKLTPANRNDRSILGLDPNRVSSISGISFGNTRQHSDTVRKLELAVLGGLSDVPNSVCSIGMKGNDDMVAFGCRDGAVRVFTLPSLPRRVVRFDSVVRPHGPLSCNQVRWSTYLNGLVTCGDDKALHISTLERSTDYIVRSFNERGHQRAVLGFAWSDAVKQLASYSAERVVYLWDRMQAAPTNRIASLSAPVCSVAFQEHDFQLLVHTHDNALRIFDLRTNTVVQTITEHNIPAEYGNLTTSIFANQRIVTGTTYPVQYVTRRELGTNATEYHGHVHPCLFFAESEGATTLVSVDTDTAYTWNLHDGSLRFSFSVASFRKNLLEEMRLTATCTDSSSRRLVTGFHKGSVVIWNMSNGQALSQLNDERFAGSAITAVHTTVRHGTTFYVVAAHTLIAVCESSSKQYSIHAREYCRIPSICGTINVITSVNDNTIACGTTVGAVLFLNLLTMTVEGEPLLPPVCDSELHRRVSHAVMLSASPHLRTHADREDEESTDPQSTSGVRIEALHMMKGPWTEPHLITTYSNGQVIIWNALWRTAAAILYVATISGFPTAFSFHQIEGHPEELIVAYGDDVGNIYANRARISQTQSAAGLMSRGHTIPVGDRAPIRLSIDLALNTVVVDAPTSAAVSAVHCFASNLSHAYRGPDEPFEIHVGYATLHNVEAKLFAIDLPPHTAPRCDFEAAYMYGVLGGPGWADQEVIAKTTAHYDAIEFLVESLSPVAKSAGSPEMAQAARDAKSVHDLLQLLNRAETTLAGQRSESLFTPLPPRTPAAVSRPRKRLSLTALLPSSGDPTGSTFANPVHMPPILTPSTQSRILVGKPQASPIVKVQRLYQRHASFKNTMINDVDSEDDDGGSSDGAASVHEAPEDDVPNVRLDATLDRSQPAPSNGRRNLNETITSVPALPISHVERRHRHGSRNRPLNEQAVSAPVVPPLLSLDATPRDRLAQQEARLSAVTQDTLGRRLKEIGTRLNLQPTPALTARPRRDTTTVDWTVRASARLAPTALGSYQSADLLLDVLQLRNPALASRAVLPSAANTSVFGTLSRSRRE